jgi:hypothetical protein
MIEVSWGLVGEVWGIVDAGFGGWEGWVFCVGFDGWEFAGLGYYLGA